MPATSSLARTWIAAAWIAALLVIATAAVAMLGACATVVPSAPLSEPGAPGSCPHCEKPLVLGEEAALTTADGSRVRYRCVHCGLWAQATSSEDSRLQVLTPVRRATVTIERRNGTWRTEPDSAVFLILPELGGECLDRHKACVDRQELDAYVATRPDLVGANPRPFTIAEITALLAAGLPDARGR